MRMDDSDSFVAMPGGQGQGSRRMESLLMEWNNRAVELLLKNDYRNHCPADEEEELRICQREDEAFGYWRRALALCLNCTGDKTEDAGKEEEMLEECSSPDCARAISIAVASTAAAAPCAASTPSTPSAKSTKKQRSAAEDVEADGQTDNEETVHMSVVEMSPCDTNEDGTADAYEVWKDLRASVVSPERHQCSISNDAIRKVLATLEAESGEEAVDATVAATLTGCNTTSNKSETARTIRNDTLPNYTSSSPQQTVPANAATVSPPDAAPNKKPHNHAIVDATLVKTLDVSLVPSDELHHEGCDATMKDGEKSKKDSCPSSNDEEAVRLSPLKTQSCTESSSDQGEACGDYHGVSQTLYIYQRTDYDEGFHTFSGHFLAAKVEEEDDGDEDIGPTKKRKRPNKEQNRELHIAETLSTICYNVGLLHRQTSCRLENAAVCYTTALQLDHILGTPSKDLVRRRLYVLHNIGHIQYCKGRYEDALQTFDKCLNFILSRLTVMPPPPDKEDSRGPTWEQFGGMKKCADFPLEDPSKDSLVYAATLNCMGVLYSHCSRDDDEIALTGTEGALKIFRGQANAQREVATCLNNLARLHGRTGNTTTDLEMTMEAMEIRRAILGRDHIDVAVMVSNTIITFIGTHRLDEALEMCKEFLRIAKLTAIGCGNAPNRRQRRRKKGSVEGKDGEDGYHRGHRDVALVLLSMGQIYQSKEMLAEATEVLHQALRMSRRAFGRNCDHLTMADILKRLGLVYIDREELEEAQKTFSKELQLRRALQDEPLNIAAVLVSMAQIHEQREEYHTAIDVYGQVLTMQQEELASKRDCKKDDDADAVMAQEEVIQTLHNIGRLQYGQRNYHAALGTYQTVLSMERDLRDGDQDDVSIAMTLTSIGIILQCLKEYPLAMRSQLEALRIRRNDRRAKLVQEERQKRKEEDHNTRIHIPLRQVDRDPNIAISFYNVGDILEDVGCPSEALTYSLAALSIERATLGEVDSEVVGTLEQVGRLFAWNMQFEEAVPFYEESLRARRIMLSSSPSCCAKSSRKKKSLEESQRKIVELLVTLAKMYLLQRRIADMMKCLVEAKSLMNQLQQPDEVEQDLLWGSGGGGNVQLYHATLLLPPSCAPLA